MIHRRRLAARRLLVRESTSSVRTANRRTANRLRNHGTRRMAIALLLIVWLARAGAASAAGGACVGDCKGIGRVDISDLIVGVNIALGVMPVSACRAFVNAAGELDIAQLVAGVHNALDGCDPPRFVDNGDGTITDTETGLMWEKKVGIGAGVDLGNLHAADNAYPWSGRCMHRSDVCQPDAAAAAACQQVAEGPLDGCTLCPDVGNPCKVGGADGETTVWSWLVQLNASGFAGFSDWRIPTIAELESIVDYMTTFPAVDGALHGAQCGPTCLDVNSPACSCTQFAIYNQQLGPYWSATAANLPFVEWWSIAFAGGGATYGGNLGGLPLDAFVRAVRGGGTKPMPRFVDNGDATVTDRQTGLMWEQKDAAGGLHDANSVYTWAGLCSAASGVAVGGVLCQPNAAAAAACARGAQLDRGPCDPAVGWWRPICRLG